MRDPLLRNKLIDQDMIEEKTRERIIALMKREVVPAVGCTEPIALCFVASTAFAQDEKPAWAFPARE